MKIIFIISAFFYFLSNFQVTNGLTPNEIDPNTYSIINNTGATGFDILDNILKSITDHVFALLAVIVIGVFVYIGFLFITSSGDEAQFKKAWKTFVYTIIGLIIIVLSWGIVKLVTSIGL